MFQGDMTGSSLHVGMLNVQILSAQSQNPSLFFLLLQSAKDTIDTFQLASVPALLRLT